MSNNIEQQLYSNILYVCVGQLNSDYRKIIGSGDN